MGRNNLVVDRDKKQFTMTRVFASPLEKVWKVVTDPKLVPMWWGPAKYKTVVEEMDFKVGGKWRYTQSDAEGNSFAFYGEYKEIVELERIVYTFIFSLYPDYVSTDHITFEELPDGKTRITDVTTFNTVEELDGMVGSGMEGGATESWDRLEELAKSTA